MRKVSITHVGSNATRVLLDLTGSAFASERQRTQTALYKRTGALRGASLAIPGIPLVNVIALNLPGPIGNALKTCIADYMPLASNLVFGRPEPILEAPIVLNAAYINKMPGRAT